MSLIYILKKIVNVPQGQQRDKNERTNFSIRQKYPINSKKEKENNNF
jgi:hypothetical protein